ncbi:MAG: DnaA regulatory inactivator Hda [Zoogloeaceae bacterium]|jgi:DnaA family protein|nr:DnaA regulatory inactivator Hda [Zoogloeaceae bacterium]
MRQLLLELLPPALPTLDNFVPGSNAETLDALTFWLSGKEEGARKKPSAFFLWGEPGSGKTHLLRASGFFYCDARTNPALTGLSGAGIFLAVDHLEALDAAGQVALFHAYNRVNTEGGRLLCAAASPPARLSELREDARTRLGQSLIYRLQTLTDTEKKAALSHMAALRALPLSAEAIAYLLSHASRDMRALASILSALDRYSLEQKRPLTLPLLRVVLAESVIKEKEETS